MNLQFIENLHLINMQVAILGANIVHLGLHCPLFSSRWKNKKIEPRKKFLIFQEIELSSSNIKKFLISSYILRNGNPLKSLYISWNENPKKPLIFRKIEFFSTSSKNKKASLWKKFLRFWDMKLSGSNNKNVLVFSEKKAFLIFPIPSPSPHPPKVFIFQETETLKRLLYFRKQNFYHISESNFLSSKNGTF